MSSDNDIRKQFQEKFRDFKAEIPPGGWERLEKALDAAPSVVITPRRRWRYAVSAVAAVLLLILGILPFLKQPYDQAEPLFTESVSPAPSDETSVATATGPLGLEAEKEAMAEKTTEPFSIGTHGEEKILAEHRSQEKTIPSNWPLEVTIPQSHKEKVEKAVSEIIGGELNSIMIPLGRGAVPEELIIVATDQRGVLVEKTGKQKDQQPIMLAMGGRGALSPYQQTVNMPMTLRSASVSADENEENRNTIFTTQNAGDNVSQMEHDQPISLGLTLSKKIVDDLYIETGLVYSYLHSKVRNASSSFEVKETQRLHYIGVPLNVNYNIISLKKLNVYASVGGMVEKDVYGDFRRMGEAETMANNRSEELEITKISQRNPQISVNAGVGLSYPLYNRIKLYGKIGGSYYFDAENEHKTIYSDRKIVMDLNVGLKYEF